MVKYPPCPPYDLCPPWVRPSDWPALPDIAEGEEKIAGLVAVIDTTSEFLAVLCAGAYTVDWGDGSAPENVASGVKAEHSYDYSGLAGGVLSEGYKVVTVEITPQAGQNLTSVNFQQRHTTASTNSHLAKWLDLTLSVPNCTSLTLGAETYNWDLPPVPATHISWLRQVTILAHATTDFYHLFSYAYALRSVAITDTSAVTNMSDMFFCCTSLLSVPLFDTSSVTNMSFMFCYCEALKCVPLFDTSSVTLMEYMFYSCVSLPSIPQFDTSAVTSMLEFLGNCAALRYVPLLDTANVTNMSHMFNGCGSLREVPALDTSSNTTMYSMFNDCQSLVYLPLLDTSSVTNATFAFIYMFSCARIPAFDFSSVTSTNDIVFINSNHTRIEITGMRYRTRYRYMPLSATALNEIFTNLGTAAGTTRTIEITGCSGAATCDRTIATAKGWTVTG